jgi:hypothetical protein
MYSLHCLNPLKHLFYPTAEARQIAEAKTKNQPGGLSVIERLSGLGKPKMSFHPSSNSPHDMRMDSFSLLGRDKVVIIDSSSRRTSLYNTDLGILTAIASRKSSNHSFGIGLPMIQTNPVGQTEDQSLYVMDLSCDTKIDSCFEMLSYRDGWGWHTLPAPPFLSANPSFRRNFRNCCYAVVDSSTICISSMLDGMGTYTFDTVSHVWRQVGNWVLPFCGKAEYVPELKIWLGLSDCKASPILCALDLSTMDSQQPPMPQHTWDYLDLSEDINTSISELYLVNLGSGMFCIATLLRTMFYPYDEDMCIIDEEFVVLTGVKVERCCNGSEYPVQMTKHKSKRCNLKRFSLKSVL